LSVVEPYNLAPEFERAVLALCCQNPRFWSRVGHVLDLDAMGHPLAKHILVACAQISAEVGHGPSASIIVLQRLQRLVDDGKLRREDIAAVVHLLDQAEDAGLPELEQAVNELVPVEALTRRGNGGHGRVSPAPQRGARWVRACRSSCSGRPCSPAPRG
jgi:lysozyme family protein